MQEACTSAVLTHALFGFDRFFLQELGSSEEPDKPLALAMVDNTTESDSGTTTSNSEEVGDWGGHASRLARDWCVSTSPSSHPFPMHQPSQ